MLNFENKTTTHLVMVLNQNEEYVFRIGSDDMVDLPSVCVGETETLEDACVRACSSLFGITPLEARIKMTTVEPIYITSYEDGKTTNHSIVKQFCEVSKYDGIVQSKTPLELEMTSKVMEYLEDVTFYSEAVARYFRLDWGEEEEDDDDYDC